MTTNHDSIQALDVTRSRESAAPILLCCSGLHKNVISVLPDEHIRRLTGSTRLHDEVRPNELYPLGSHDVFPGQHEDFHERLSPTLHSLNESKAW